RRYGRTEVAPYPERAGLCGASTTLARAPGSECDAVAELGNVGFPAQTVAQRLLQGLHVLQLAVHQMQLGARLEMADPVDQLGLAGVGREAAQRVHLRVHRDALVHQLDGPGAIDDRPPQRAAGLEAGYHQVTFLAPEVVLEMMQDAPAGAHAAAGDDDHAALEAVD